MRKKVPWRRRPRRTNYAAWEIKVATTSIPRMRKAWSSTPLQIVLPEATINPHPHSAPTTSKIMTAATIMIPTIMMRLRMMMWMIMKSQRRRKRTRNQAVLPAPASTTCYCTVSVAIIMMHVILLQHHRLPPRQAFGRKEGGRHQQEKMVKKKIRRMNHRSRSCAFLETRKEKRTTAAQPTQFLIHRSRIIMGTARTTIILPKEGRA
mmetsp:Transcript_6406/g.18879  ORF Transcript_6406/g.18879 Transcript_6406/m.18879 type:complete len:207 (+) Transcript_6406:565-1185(+)